MKLMDAFFVFIMCSNFRLPFVKPQEVSHPWAAKKGKAFPRLNHPALNVLCGQCHAYLSVGCMILRSCTANAKCLSADVVLGWKVFWRDGKRKVLNLLVLIDSRERSNL